MSLLNLDNVPGRIISGEDEETLKWLTGTSNSQYVLEFGSEFKNMLSEEDVQDIPEHVIHNNVGRA